LQNANINPHSCPVFGTSFMGKVSVFVCLIAIDTEVRGVGVWRPLYNGPNVVIVKHFYGWSYSFDLSIDLIFAKTYL